jgi:superfamily II DNA/RNA helicase
VMSMLRSPFNLKKTIHREGRQGREGKQITSFGVKITSLVIASGFTFSLISLASLASLAVQLLDLVLTVYRQKGKSSAIS